MQALDKSDSRTTHDKDLIYRPREKMDILLGFKFGGFEINAVDHYVGKRYINAANTTWLGPYNLIDANVGYGFKALGTNVSLKLDLINIGNLDYIAVDGTPERGRAFRFTVGCGL